MKKSLLILVYFNKQAIMFQSIDYLINIDILIEPTKEMGFFEIIRLEDELKEKLKKKIDLITYASIHKLLKDRILQEEVRIILKKIHQFL